MGENNEDVEIALLVAERIAQAKARLALGMASLGLTSDKGWRVAEVLRNRPDGHEFVFRPIHMQYESELEVSVPIGPDGRPV